MSPPSYCPSATRRSRRWCALLVLLGFVRREEARLGEVGREGYEERDRERHLAEELEAREVERDGHVRRAAPLTLIGKGEIFFFISIFF